MANALSDYNRDGMSDLVWNDPTANRAMVWLMRGTEPFERGPELPGPPGDGWLCVALPSTSTATAWRTCSGKTRRRTVFTVWLMHGTEPFEQGPEIPGPGAGWSPASPPTSTATAWRTCSGTTRRRSRMAVWLMRGTEVRARGAEIPTPPSSDWILAAAGDYNADRAADVLWFNAKRQADRRPP